MPNDPNSNMSTQRGLPDITIGIKVGFSLSQHSGIEERGTEYDVSSDWRSGAGVGVFLHLPITHRFGLQQEVLYVQKGSRQDISVDILDIPTVLHVTYDMDYIEIPVLLKYAWFTWERTEIYSLAGWALSFKVNDRYTLDGEVDDGTEKAPLNADSDMSEVEMFDYSFIYGFGLDFSLFEIPMLVEYRFAIGLNRLMMPTYAYVPFGDEKMLIENDPVPLKNQNHLWMLGINF
ncbi:MAG: porin family protein [bacterium]